MEYMTSLTDLPYRLYDYLFDREYYVCKNVVMLYEQLHVIRRLTPFSAVNYIRKGIGYEEYLKKQNQSKNIPWPASFSYT